VATNAATEIGRIVGCSFTAALAWPSTRPEDVLLLEGIAHDGIVSGSTIEGDPDGKVTDAHIDCFEGKPSNRSWVGSWRF